MWIVLVVFVVSRLSSPRYLVHGKWMPRYQYKKDLIQYVHLICGNSVHTFFLLSVTHSLKRYTNWTIHRNIKYNKLLQKVAIIFRLPRFIWFSRILLVFFVLSYFHTNLSFFLLSIVCYCITVIYCEMLKFLQFSRRWTSFFSQIWYQFAVSFYTYILGTVWELS